jgi:endonuclease/exonuclease/phosphatase family metal-dependent hydrolase
MTATPPRSIKIISLNVCGLPGTGFASRRGPIGKALGKLDADIVALQEIFFEGDARKLDRHVGLPHRFRYKRLGMLAGGLVLYSRQPLVEARFIPFSEQGAWYRLSFLSRLNQKGFIFTRWERPRLGIINTHLLANYVRRYERGQYARWQEKQVEQLARFINRLDPDLPLVVAGDFNVPPQGRPYRHLRAAGLVDSMLGCTQPSMLSRDELNLGILSPTESIRIDYVFFKGSESAERSLVGAYALDKEGLSDHRGLLADVRLG